MGTPRNPVSTSRWLSICALVMAYSIFVAAVPWDLVRAGGAGWNDRLVLLQHFERSEYDHLYEGTWTDFIQNNTPWYRAIDYCASLLGGFDPALTLFSFVVSAIYAASVLGTSLRLLPLLFVPMQIDLFDTQIRSACAGALLVAALKTDRVALSIVLALLSVCMHNVAALLLGLWIAATLTASVLRGSSASGLKSLTATSVVTCGVITILSFISQTSANYSTNNNSGSVAAFCVAMSILGIVAAGRKGMDAQALFSFMVLLLVAAGSPLELGLQRLLPLTMPVIAASFLRFPAPYPLIAGALCLVAQIYWTARWVVW